MNEPHESGAILIFFSVDNWAGRKFRLVVWPKNHAGRMEPTDFEEQRKDALGTSSWMPVSAFDGNDEPNYEYLKIVIGVLGLALHGGTIPAPGIDLGTVKP